MTILISGVLLWTAAHMFGRIAPGVREPMGKGGRGLVAALVLAALALMVWGYRGAEFVPLYTPLPGMGHANNLLMLFAIYMFGVSHSRGVLRAHIRHPMLWGVILWAAAHLLVNGDLASVILFGGLGLWAAGSIRQINAAGPWDRPAPGALRGDLIGIPIALAVFGLVAGIHIWLGHNPFLGTYP